MSKEELVNIFDDDGNLLGVMNRQQAEAENRRTENVVVLVFTPEGKLWMQQRPHDKTFHPGLWDISACGGVESHEHRDTAAARETQEELGLTPDLQYIDTLMREIPSEDGALYPRLSHFYIGESDQEPQLNEEVLALKAWHINDLYDDMEKNSHIYTPNLKILIDKALATKNPSS